MNPAEAAVLLGVAAGFDNRKPDADIAQAWAIALEDMRFEDARDAVVAHYRKPDAAWLMPGHVIAEVKRIREKRINEAPPQIPPPGLTEPEERMWLRERRRLIADGGPLPEVDYGELRERHLPDLRELMPGADA